VFLLHIIHKRSHVSASEYEPRTTIKNCVTIKTHTVVTVTDDGDIREIG